MQQCTLRLLLMPGWPDIQCLQTKIYVHNSKHRTVNAYYSLSRKKSEPLKDFATTCVNLHQIKYIFTHTQPHVFQTMLKVCFVLMDTYDVLKFLENKLLRLRNQIVNKITQKLRLHSTAAVNPESDNSPNI